MQTLLAVAPSDNHFPAHDHGIYTYIYALQRHGSHTVVGVSELLSSFAGVPRSKPASSCLALRRCLGPGCADIGTGLLAGEALCTTVVFVCVFVMQAFQ